MLRIKLLNYFIWQMISIIFFNAMAAKYTLRPTAKRKYHRNSTMSKAEIMLIMILFHNSGYRCLKYFYQEKICKHMRHFSPRLSLITVLLNWKEKWPSRWHRSSRRCFLENA